MRRSWVRRRMFDRRSGVDRRRTDSEQGAPDVLERREGERRSGEDRRSPTSRVPSERLTDLARDWMSRLPG